MQYSKTSFFQNCIRALENVFNKIMTRGNTLQEGIVIRMVPKTKMEKRKVVEI